jgi:hypothetical protein
MKRSSIFFPAIFLCFLMPALGQEPSPLVPSQTISLSSMQGGFNHMSVDAEHHRLFAAAPTNQTLEILDVNSGKSWRSLAGEKPAAARYAPEFNQLYVPRGQSLVIYDGRTFEPITSVDLQSNLDELQYDAHAKQLYVGCMTAGKIAIAVIGLPEGKLLGQIALPGKPQGIAVEQKGKRIFANMPSLKQIAVIDRETRTLVATWPVADAQGNAPIALDEAHHRLFVGARQPAKLIVFDTTTGKPVTDIAINGDTDDLFYDAAHKRIYVSCGEGFIDVIDQQGADRYQLRARIPTVAGARTSTFSSELNVFYLGVPRHGNDPAEIRVFKVEN